MTEKKPRVDQFCRRLPKLYAAWEEEHDGSWKSATAFAMHSGVKPDALLYLKSISLQLWLLGIEVPGHATIIFRALYSKGAATDSLIVFGKKKIHIVSTQKRVEQLKTLIDPCLQETGIAVELLVRPKYSDNASYLDSSLQFIQSSGDPYTLGVLPKERHSGKLSDDWAAAMVQMQNNAVDLGSAIGTLLSCKEDEEVTLIKKAAYLAGRVSNEFVVSRLERCMEESLSVKHSDLSGEIAKVIIDPRRHGIKLLPENCDIAFEPLFQSGSDFDIKLGMPSDDRTLKEGCIVMMLGTRYDSYCAAVGRCFFVDAPLKVKDEYTALMAAEEAGIAALRPGLPLKSVREAVVRTLNERNMGHLVEKLGKSIGYLMGTELRDSYYSLNDKNRRIIIPKMVFHLSLLVTGLEWENEEMSKRQSYALFVMDTVLVTETGQEVLTVMSKRDWSDVSYYNEKDEIEEEKLSPQPNPVILDHRLRRKDGMSEDEHVRESRRRVAQKQLEEVKNKETLARLTGQAPLPNHSRRAKGRSILEVAPYGHIRDIPPSKARQPTVQIDKERECILLPIFGLMVPFHVLSIRNVISQADGERAYIRVNFNFGGAYEPSTRHPTISLIKELSFRTADVYHASQTVNEVKTLRQFVMNRDKELAERATLVAQEELVKGRRSVVRLPDLWVRPSLGIQGRKMSGILEAHQNGFRYFAPKGALLDIMYRNLRYAFFQPASKELLTILHFQLIDPIMVGKRKTSCVQFYTEISDIVTTVEGGRRSAFDPDEIEEELREKERVYKINQEFQQFVKRVQEHWYREYTELNLEFDVPFREIGFYGVPQKSNVFIMPTANCLVELTEFPSTVVPIEDVEIVNLERVGFNLKNFDMTIVFKDFEREVLRIDTVPSSYLDTIKEWLTSVKLKYYETKMNLAWRPILKSIVDDPEEFISTGGWSFLDMNLSDDDSNDEGDADSEFQPSEESGDDESIEEDSEQSSSLVDSDATENDGSEEEEEEEQEPGLTWDELEAEARKDDKRFEHSDSDSEYRTKKRKAKIRIKSSKKMRL